MRFNTMFASMSAAGCLLLATSAPAADAGPVDLLAAAPAPVMAAAPADAAADSGLVMGIQRGLILRGYDPGPVDGKMGPKTRRAIASYQEDQGLDATGTADRSLHDRLLAGASPPSEPKPAITGSILAPALSEPAEPDAWAAPAMAATPAVERWHSHADGQPLSSVETAIVSFFDFMRDSTLFLVGQFSVDDEGAVAAVPTSLAETDQTAAGP